VLRSSSIARRLAVMSLLVSGLVLLITASSFVAYQFWAYRRSAHADLSVRARVLAANSTAALAFADEAAARELLAALRADPSIVAAVLFDVTGAHFATYMSAERAEPLPATPEADGYRFEGGRLIGYQPVAEADGPRLGTLYVASDAGAVREALTLSAAVGVVVTALSLLAALGLSNVLQRRITQPILALSKTATAFSSTNDYSVRAPTAEQGGEIGELTRAFNQMLARIEEQARDLEAGKEELAGYANELEQRVARRTGELEHSNEALRRNAAELTVANKELDAFAYSVSHDLRAPLRSIDGFSQVLLDDYAGVLDDQGQHFLGRVRAASQRMGALIDDMLNLSRITRMEMNPQPIDLSAMAAEVATELRAAHPDRDVAFRVEPDVAGEGDARLLRVVLHNLIGNGWKYTGKCTEPRVEFGARSENGARVYFVRDNGAGFDMRYADKLFGEFQRLHAQDEFEGTGVGLATARRIVNRHGGRIWAESAVGEGATFYFTL
jgi:signal transduction histidine kinase